MIFLPFFLFCLFGVFFFTSTNRPFVCLKIEPFCFDFSSLYLHRSQTLLCTTYLVIFSIEECKSYYIITLSGVFFFQRKTRVHMVPSASYTNNVIIIMYRFFFFFFLWWGCFLFFVFVCWFFCVFVCFLYFFTSINRPFVCLTLYV